MIAPLNEAGRDKLLKLHRSLLDLHKILLDDERKAYEAERGPVQSTGELLNLVMYDPWFDWLHRISEIIVKIDEITEADDATMEQASDLMNSLRTLFRAGAAEETPFMVRYKSVLKREPSAILAHVEVQKILLPEA